MAITYLGNAEFAEVEEPSFDGDIYGLDTLTRTYEGRQDKSGAFITSKVGKNDHDFLFMTFDTYSFSGSQGVARVQLKYVGKLSNIHPMVSEPEYDARLTTMTVTGITSGIQLTLVYKSPMVRTRWASRTRPNWNDRFINLPESQIEVTAIEGANAVRLEEYGETARAILTSEEFGLRPINERTSFPRIRAGMWWRNTETIERRLVQVGKYVIL